MRLAPPAPPRSDATRAADSLAVAETLQNAFGAAAAKALPVVVQVNVVEVVRQNATRSVTPFDYFFGQPGQQQPRRGLGSGVIVGRDGDTVYVLTNNHVAGSASEIQVVLSDKKEYTGKLVGADARLDLALVSFTTKEVVPIAVLGDSANLRVGDWVLAVGNPYGFTGSVTAGIISALNRHADSRTGIADLTDYIQTDASINSGNSGGALVNLRGEVVGINTWIASQSGGSIGIGFSIPINNAKDAITEFIRSGKLVYGWLGVSIVDPTPQATPGLAEDLSLGERTGSFVINVVKGSPADRAGVLPGDYVIRAGDTSILTTQQLTEMVARLKPNTDLPLAVIRQGAERRLGVRILERPAEDTGSGPSNLWPGMLVLPLTETTRSQLQLAAGAQGVVIASMDEQSASGIAGARRGDLVLQLNGSPVGSVSEFYRLLNAAGGREVSLRVQRQGREATVTFRK
jgi:serine protease Do